MDNLWGLIKSLGELLMNLGEKLWFFLNTPFNELIEELPPVLEELTSFLLDWLIGDYTPLELFIPFTIVFLVIKLWKMLT